MMGDAGTERDADEANGAPSTAQTVWMNDGKDDDPPRSENRDAEEVESVELAPAGLEELEELYAWRG